MLTADRLLGAPDVMPHAKSIGSTELIMSGPATATWRGKEKRRWQVAVWKERKEECDEVRQSRSRRRIL